MTTYRDPLTLITLAAGHPPDAVFRLYERRRAEGDAPWGPWYRCAKHLHELDACFLRGNEVQVGVADPDRTCEACRSGKVVSEAPGMQIFENGDAVFAPAGLTLRAGGAR